MRERLEIGGLARYLVVSDSMGISQGRRHNMNRFERPDHGEGEAVLQYLDGDYRVLKSGSFVRCAVSGRPIPLGELRYWSVPRQEAYCSPEIAAEIYQALQDSRSG